MRRVPSLCPLLRREGSFPLAALCAALLGTCSAHVTFKLPAIPGVSPGNAGGYGASPLRRRRLRLTRVTSAPFDGNYLSNSPFMLNIPHSKPGNLVVGLQCSVPAGVSATPQALPGYALTLGLTAAGAVTNFTYSITADALYPNGFVQPAINYAAANTLLSIFLGVSISAPACTFPDATRTAIVAGYPTLFFPCAEITVPAATNLSSWANIMAAPLSVLLWTQTPASSATPAIGASYALDGGAAAAGCVSWPCSAAAPFGGASATVLEASTAPKIALLPQGCTGVNCTAVGGSILAPFANCPAGKVTMAGALTGGSYVVVGAASGGAKGMSNPDIVAWLSIITAVCGSALLVQVAAALHARLARVARVEAEVKATEV